MERDHYQIKAMECLFATGRLRDPAERLRLLGIAQQYPLLAAHVTTRLTKALPIGPSTAKREIVCETIRKGRTTCTVSRS
jgi:hypothetical protein